VVWLCLRWWVVLYKSWAVLVSRMLRKWWSLIRSVRNRDGVILLLYACVVYLDCEYCGCYCFVVFGEVLVVVLLACRNSLCCASHLSVLCHFVYCFSGLVLEAGLGVVCGLEPSVGIVSDYSFEDGVWLDCQFVVYLVVHFCCPVYVVSLYCVHHLAFVSYV